MPTDNSGGPRGGRSWRRYAAVAALIAASVISLAGFAAERKTKEKPAAAAPAETSPPASSPTSGTSPEPEKLGGNSPAWTVACLSSARSAPADCKVEQRLFAKDTGRILSIAIIDVPGDSRQPSLQMRLPAGLALQDGVSLTIDGANPAALQWQSCDGTGCYATLALTPAVVEAMKKGKIMAVKAVAANRRPLVFEHLLTDFAAAYGAAQ